MLAPVRVRQLVARISRLSRTRTTRSTTSGCARRSASRSTATRSTTPNAAAWAWSTATGSTTTSNTACEWPKWRAQHRQGQAADGGGRLSQRLQGRLGDRRCRTIIRAASASSRSCRRSASARGCRSMERGVFLKKMQGGLKEWPGVQIILNATRIGGTWSNWYDTHVQMRRLPRPRTSSASRSSTTSSTSTWPRIDRNERKKLAEQIQRDDPGKLLFRPGVPPRLCQCDRAAHRGRRNGRTCSRRSPPATPIRGRTSS